MQEKCMMHTFNLVVVPNIHGKNPRNLEKMPNVTSWAIFDERLRDEYFHEDIERVNKKYFLDWVE